MSERLRHQEEHAPARSGSDIAVVVIALRAPPELVQCVESLLAQDVVPEILVVNSGGGNAAALLGARGLHVPVLEYEAVLFAGAARNAGIAATRSPIVAFLASDCLAEPGWVARRLASHRAGHAAVASALVNSHPRNLVAWAAHLSTFVLRMPEIPEKAAIRYGASYERSLFAEHGLFREDLRTGEDTEFHRRLPSRLRPAWDPLVRTIHRNPTSLRALLSDQHRRGAHAAHAYETIYGFSPQQFMRKRIGALTRGHRLVRRALRGTDRVFAVMAGPLMVVAAAAYFSGAVSALRTRRRRDADAARQREAARQAQERRDWSGALEMWEAILEREPHRLEAVRSRALMLHRLKRHEEALAALSSIVQRHPDDAAAVRGLASVLAAVRDWASALDQWERALKLAPDDRTALNGRGEALLQLGRIDEAEAAFRGLIERHPDRPAGLSGLLKVMSLRPDDDGVIAVAGTLWERHRTPSAAHRLVAALARVGRQEQAERFIAGLERCEDQAVLASRLRSTLYRASCQWARLAEQISANRASGASGHDTLMDEIEALLVLDRVDDLRRLLEESPPIGPERMTTGVLTAIAKVFGRSGVHRALMPLLHPPDLWRLSGTALHCAVASAEPCDSPVLENAFRQLREGLPSGPKRRELALAAPSADAFRASLAVVHGSRDWPAGKSWYGESVERGLMLAVERTGGLGSGERRLHGFVERIQALRHQGRPLYLHVACDFGEALTVADAIVEAVDRRKPMSVLRLGDGEGSLLPCQDDLIRHRPADQAHFFNAWWNRPGDDGEIAYLEEALSAAVEQADIVGIPDPGRLALHVRRLSDEQLMLPSLQMMRGYARILEYTLAPQAATGRILTSSHFHESFLTWGLWQLILRYAGTCSLITCHAALPARLARDPGVQVKRTYLIPPEAKWAGAFSETVPGKHFPDRFHELKDEIEVRRGDLYLVAAGILGKIYCQWIKAAGGIAVDIGSVADHWCGYRTRYSIDALQTIGTVSMDGYRRLAQRDTRIARMLAGRAA